MYDSVTPANVDTQGIVDRLIDEMAPAGQPARLDGLVYVWYPRAALITSSGAPTSSNAGVDTRGIMIPYDAHVASSKSSRLPHAVMLSGESLSYPGVITDATWTNLTAFANNVLAEFSDPNYLRVNSLPFVGLLEPAEVTGTALTNWLAVKAILGPIYQVGFGSINTGAWTSTGCQTGTNYGVNGAQIAGTGQNPWSNQVTKDLSIAGQAGFDLAFKVNPLVDQRPRKGEGGCSWTDRPSAPDFVTAMQYAQSRHPKFIFLSPVNELDEEGMGIASSVQDSSFFSDLIAYSKGANTWSQYSYRIGASLQYATATGTWTRTTGVTGSYDTTEMRSSTTSDTISLSHARVNRMLLYGGTGPDRGIMTVQIDASTVATVDTYSASAQVDQLLFTSSALSVGTHTVQATETGTKNGSSSANTIGIDAIGVTWQP